MDTTIAESERDSFMGTPLAAILSKRHNVAQTLVSAASSLTRRSLAGGADPLVRAGRRRPAFRPMDQRLRHRGRPTGASAGDQGVRPTKPAGLAIVLSFSCSFAGRRPIPTATGFRALFAGNPVTVPGFAPRIRSRVRRVPKTLSTRAPACQPQARSRVGRRKRLPHLFGRLFVAQNLQRLPPQN